MSYNVYVKADLGGEELFDTDVLDHWNYTSNVAGMWRRAMPDTNGLAGMEGKTCAEVLPSLERGIADMEANPEPYRAMNPDNGWGDFGSQLERLKELRDAFRRAPKGIVHVSR